MSLPATGGRWSILTTESQNKPRPGTLASGIRTIDGRGSNCSEGPTAVFRPFEEGIAAVCCDSSLALEEGH